MRFGHINSPSSWSTNCFYWHITVECFAVTSTGGRRTNETSVICVRSEKKCQFYDHQLTSQRRIQLSRVSKKKVILPDDGELISPKCVEYREVKIIEEKCTKLVSKLVTITYWSLLLLLLLLLLLWRYSPFCALASFTNSLHRSLSRASFHHAFTSEVLLSFNTESSHLNPVIPFFLLPSGWKKVMLGAPHTYNFAFSFNSVGQTVSSLLSLACERFYHACAVKPEEYRSVQCVI